MLSLLRRVLPAVGRDADGHGAHGHGGGRGGGRGHHRGQVHPHHQRRRVRHLRHGVSYVQQVSFTSTHVSIVRTYHLLYKVDLNRNKSQSLFVPINDKLDFQFLSGILGESDKKLSLCLFLAIFMFTPAPALDFIYHIENIIIFLSPVWLVTGCGTGTACS